MKPTTFDYVRVDNIADAIARLGEADGDGKVLAGGQSLVPLMNMRLARPAVVVDINRVPGLDGIEATGSSSIRIGALVRHRQLVEQPLHQLLATAAAHIGHGAIRTRGTIGGSLAHADPAAELPVVTVATGGSVTATGPHGDRTLPIDDLFLDLFETALAHDEIITAVEVRLPERWGFAELSRRHGDFAQGLVAVCEVGGEFRIALGAVGPTPVRAHHAEAIVNAGPLTPTRVAEAAAAAGDALSPPGDLHGSAAYRRAVASHLVRQALTQAGRQ